MYCAIYIYIYTYCRYGEQAGKVTQDSLDTGKNVASLAYVSRTLLNIYYTSTTIILLMGRTA